MKTKIGFITIGFAPRPELIDWVPDDFITMQNGVLNEIPEKNWMEFKPEQGETPLYTSARGEEIILSAEKIEPYLTRVGSKLVLQGADFLVVLCSAPIPRFASEVPVLLPHNLIHSLMDRMLPTGRLGLIAPDPSQEEMMRKTWQTGGRKMIFVPHPPYGKTILSDDQIRLLEKCNLVLADCFGYNVSFRIYLQGKISSPVLLVREVTMVFLQQLQGLKRKRKND